MCICICTCVCVIVRVSVCASVVHLLCICIFFAYLVVPCHGCAPPFRSCPRDQPALALAPLLVVFIVVVILLLRYKVLRCNYTDVTLLLHCCYN
jgi:hypothetical protein